MMQCHTKEVFIAAGIIQFDDNDAELATVNAYELSQNTMRYIQKQQTNQTAGTAEQFGVSSAVSRPNALSRSIPS